MNKSKTILVAALLGATAASAQTQVMSIYKADGTKVQYALTDIERVAFEEKEEVTSFANGEGTLESPYIINNVDELLLLQKLVNAGDSAYVSACYALQSDIDLQGMEWTPIGQGRGNESAALAETDAFLGTFDGGGHTISNLNLNFTGNGNVAFAGLFGLLGKGATVQNLNLTGAVTASAEASDSVATNLVCGAIAGEAMYATIKDCTFNGSLIINGVLNGATQVGGIVGYLAGSISGCKATIGQEQSIVSRSSFACAGAVAGYVSAGSVTECEATVDGDVLADTRSFLVTDGVANAAALVGNSFGGSITDSKATVSGCIKAVTYPETDAATDGATIYASANAGALAGAYGADQNANNSVTVSGTILAEGASITSAGGVIGAQSYNGYGAGNLSAKITSTAKITAINHGTDGQKLLAYAGGIYGMATFQTTGGTLSGCTAEIDGEILAKSDVTAYVGGIAGTCYQCVNNHALISSTAKIAADAPTFTTCGGVLGNALGNMAACYAIVGGQLSATDATQASLVGGVVGSMSGTKKNHRSAISCYSLLGGTLSGGETTVIGGVVGKSSAYSAPTTSYWYSANDNVKGETGTDESSDYKIASRDEASLTTAMEAMNATLGEYDEYAWHYEYDATTNSLVTVSTTTAE